ncbi:2-keto-4-pentenoate hydratase [Streptomyces virginiae]|uniref:2-keto-4-pentenoate hydratase n=1 Tax=Streptomyces virginiae TaxID=1961 RepID=UPI003662E3CA
MLSDRHRREAAEILYAAERRRAPVRPLTERYEGIDARDAYEIQLLGIRRRRAEGAVVTGHKVGLSSPVMQAMMGVDEPDYGHLLDGMELREDTPVPVAAYCAPRIEVEIGFVLGADLPGEGCTEADVLAATERVVPALELIDSRIADWRISLADTIADNASSAGYVVGEGRDPRELDLKAVEVSLHEHGRAPGATAPGDLDDPGDRGDRSRPAGRGPAHRAGGARRDRAHRPLARRHPAARRHCSPPDSWPRTPAGRAPAAPAADLAEGYILACQALRLGDDRMRIT